MKITTVKSARKDYPNENIKKGDTYHYCQPKSLRKTKDQKMRSKDIDILKTWISNYAKAHRGEFSTNMEDYQQRLEELDSEEDKETLYNEINEFIEEKQSRLDNMPYQLQEGSVLQEQIEQLEEILSEVESWEE